MKIRNLLYAAATLVFAAVACQEKEPQKEETPAPEIQIQKTEVTLASDGASVNVAYLIENEVEGRKISVANDAEWLTVDTGKARVITLSALINETGAQRHADVTVSYEGATSIIEGYADAVVEMLGERYRFEYDPTKNRENFDCRI